MCCEKKKGVFEFFDEEGRKVTVDLAEIKKFMLDKAAVVEVQAKLLDHNDLGVFWKMVHLSLTRTLQPKQHTQAPFTNQDMIHTYLLMNDRRINFASVVIDWLLEKVKNFNLPTFHHQNRERMEHMPYASHLTQVFKYFGVQFEGFEVQKVNDSKKIRAQTLRSMKLYRTVARRYVYQPYLREGDVMIDPSDKKFKPHRREMVFVRRKGVQPQQVEEEPQEDIPVEREEVQPEPPREEAQTNEEEIAEGEQV